MNSGMYWKRYGKAVAILGISRQLVPDTSVATLQGLKCVLASGRASFFWPRQVWGPIARTQRNVTHSHVFRLRMIRWKISFEVLDRTRRCVHNNYEEIVNKTLESFRAVGCKKDECGNPSVSIAFLKTGGKLVKEQVEQRCWNNGISTHRQIIIVKATSANHCLIKLFMPSMSHCCTN